MTTTSPRDFWVKALAEMYFGAPPGVRSRSHWRMSTETFERIWTLVARPLLIAAGSDVPPAPPNPVGAECVWTIFGRPVRLIDQDVVTFEDEPWEVTL